MLKKSIALFLASLFIIMSVGAAGFPDVTERNLPWAVDEINNMVEMGIIKGYPDGTFGPGRDVTKIEALLLSSRILGFSDEGYEPFVEIASDLYEEVLDEYDITYKDEIAFLIYKNVLKESELDVYIGSDNANLPLKRYEAATLLTKVLGAEDEARNATSQTPFTDSADIPSAAKPYVNFVSRIGLMLGMGQNEFAPMVNVNRAQIAVLLYRMMGLLNEDVEFVTITEINSSTSTIMYTNERDVKSGISLLYDDDPIIKMDGFSTTLDKLKPGSLAAIVRRDGVLYSIEAITVAVDEVFKGAVVSVYSSSTAGRITVTEIGKTERREYPLASNVSVIYEGSPGTLTSIKTNDYVELDIVAGVVQIIDAKKRDRSITGTVSEIVISPEFMLVIKHTDGSEEEYKAAEVVTTQRNGTVADFRDVMVGDRVSITLRYEKIAVINATATKTTSTGTIEEIIIAAMPSMKVKTASGNIEKYSLSRDAVYVVDGAEGNIYSLRLNATVTVNIESETVVKVTSTAPTMSSSMTGVITTVNSSYGFFEMDVINSQTGAVESKQIFLKRNAVKIIDSTDLNREKTSADLKTGMNVTVTGSLNMGAFEATTVIIVPQV